MPPTPSRLTPMMRDYLAKVEDAGVLDGGVRYTATRTIRALESLGLVTVTRYGSRPDAGAWRAAITPAGTNMLAAIDATKPPVPSVYRCATCGHGNRLFAYAHANIHGHLGLDGQLDSYDYIDTWEDPIEESIECGRHPDGIIEMCIDGVWHRPWSCPKCNSKGYIEYDGGRYRSKCSDPGFEGKHACWRPGSDWWNAYQRDYLAARLADIERGRR